MIGQFFQVKIRRNQQEKEKAIQTFDKIPLQQLRIKMTLPLIQLLDKNTMQPSDQLTKKIDLSKLLRIDPKQSLIASSQNTIKIMETHVSQIYKNTIKSNYQKLINQYKGTQKVFKDPQFPYDSISTLGQNLSKRPNIQWKRIGQIIKNPVFINNLARPEDILQGNIGDCYFMSSIASIAQHDFRIKNLFGSLQIQPNGIYMAQILIKGVLQQVVVDDYIPTIMNQPIFASASGGNQIWVIILQKCWAKANGSYDVIDKGGLPHQVLHAFTCAPTFYNYIPIPKNQQQLFFSKILQANNSDSILCCGTSQDPSIDKQGLLHAHAYSILDVYEKPFRMIKVRNPFGMVQWKGKASQSDKQFWSNVSEQDKNKIGFSVKNDGIFFILWQDFVKVFIMVDFCMVQDNASYLYIETVFKFFQPKIFEVQILENMEKLTICLSQDNIQKLNQKEKQFGYAKTILIISKNITQNGFETFSFLKASQYDSLADHYVVLEKLQKGKYTIYAECNWHLQQQKKATISLYGQGKFKLQEKKQKSFEQFVQLTALNHSKRNQKKKMYLTKDLSAWKCSQIIMGKGQLGYYVYCLQKNATIKLGITLDEKQFLSKQIKIIGSYKGKGSIKLIVNPGECIVILMKFHPYKKVSKIDLPQPKVIKLT